jgi:hypothetical protein
MVGCAAIETVGIAAVGLITVVPKEPTGLAGI